MLIRPSSARVRRERITDEGSNVQRHKLLTPLEALKLQKDFGGDGFVKLFFGLPMNTAIENGFQISEKGFFETTHSQTMDATAKTLKRILADFVSEPDLTIADLFAGTGISAWAFATEGFKVDAVEKDEFTAKYAEENLIRAEVKDKVELINTDAINFIRDARKKKRHFGAVSLDPPWNGKYDYDLEKPFFLEFTKPQLDKLAESANDLADVILFRVPQNIDLEQVYALGDKLGREVIVQFQDMEGNYPPTENTGVVYMVKKESPAKHKFERIKIPFPSQ